MIDPDLAAAARISETALAAGSGDAYDHAIVGLLRSAQGNYAAADQLFEQALGLEPGNPSTLTSLAIHYRQQGRIRDALLACDEAIRNVPDYVDAWVERGALLASGGSNASARESFARAVTLAPHHASAHAGLASLAAREGNVALARNHAVLALKSDPMNAVAKNALASAELSSANPEAAREILMPMIERLDFPGIERCMALSLLGDAAHRLGEHDLAYDYYVKSKADFAAIHADAAEGQLDHGRFVDALIEGFERVDAGRWGNAGGEHPVSAAHNHIFLIGYPRSGTTLVENILASLPGVSALEERPTLVSADKAYISGAYTDIVEGLQQFATLDTANIESLRRDYWNKVVASGIAAESAHFVDMDPLKGTRLPFISRLFPDAKILVMRRDPRDVVWSCFRTNFAMSSGTMQYTSLEKTARHYDSLMRLTEMAMARLPLAFHIVDYHRLVKDFDNETKAMCAFAGLEWSENVRSFDKTASARGVSTASVGQVNKGLFDGTRQWEPYATYLEPVLPILAPWIEKFGYCG